MAGYKLATYQTADGPRAGLVIDDKVYDAAKLTGKPAYATVLGILNDWKAAQGVLNEAAAKAGKSKARAVPLGKHQAARAGAVALGDLLRRRELCRPCRRNGPPQEPAAGARSAHPGPQVLAFHQGLARARRSGRHRQDFRLSDEVDWEVELAAVIGQPAKNVPQEKALSYVAGYTWPTTSRRATAAAGRIRDTSPFKADWIAHKSFDGSCPLGPWIVPASDIDDPQKLAIKLWVNGALKQDSNSKPMIFNLAEQIAQLSCG